MVSYSYPWTSYQYPDDDHGHGHGHSYHRGVELEEEAELGCIDGMDANERVQLAMATLGSLFGGTFIATRGGGKQQQQQQQQGPPVSASSKDEEKFIQYVRFCSVPPRFAGVPAGVWRCGSVLCCVVLLSGLLMLFSRDFLNSADGGGEQKSAQ